MKHQHHKVPKYLGGSDDESNIVELTIEEHAEAHKELYDKYGHWEDKLAWQGLLKMISRRELIRRKLSESGRKGGEITNKRYPKGTRGDWNLGNPRFEKGNQITAKTYKLVSPDGLIFEVHGLVKWCNENNLNYKAFHKAVIQRKRSHKGYKLVGN